MSSNEIGVAKSDSARRRNDFETAPVYKYFEPGILCGSLVVRGRKVNNYSYKCKICMKLNRKKNGKDTFVCSAQGISSNLFHHLKSLGHGEALAELRRNHEKRRRRRPNAVNTGNLEQNNSGYFEGGDETAPGMMEESDPNMMSSMIPSGSHHVGINHNGEGDYEDGEEDEDNDDGDMGDDDDGMYYSGEFSHAQALALAEVDNDSAYHHHHHHHHNDICSQQSQLQSPTQTQIQHRHNEGYENVFDASASVTTNSKPPSTYLNSTGLGRGIVRRPSQPAANVITTPPVTTSDGSILVGAPNQDAALVQSFRTRRTKCLINFALEDFSRIHTHFSDRNRPGYIETPVYSFQENEKIKFQLRFVPSKHHMSAEVVYRGTDFSAQLLVDIYLVDINGKRFQFDYGRRVEASVNAINSEALNNVIYDRDDLEKRRDKLFSGDKLVIGIEVNATWVDSGDQLSGISE